MDQDQLISSISRHLDRLDDILAWIILVSVATAWAGVQRQRTVTLLGLSFDRRHAFFAVASLYILANAAAVMLFLRLGDLLRLLQPSETLAGVTALVTHPWLLSPFSYFGGSSTSLLHAADGYGLLICVWWMCNGSLWLLMDLKRNIVSWLMLSLLLALGVLAMAAVQRVYRIVVLAATSIRAPEFDNFLEGRLTAGIIGLVMGAVIFIAANVLQERLLKRGAEL